METNENQLQAISRQISPTNAKLACSQGVERMHIGLIGLGTMGGRMLVRLRDHGHDVVGCDVSASARTTAANAGIRAVATVDELVAALSAPRVLWVMLPAGDTTSAVLRELADLLTVGDLVVDGGNSDFRDADARATLLGQHGIRFMDVGVSGGQWGWKTGYGLTAGGAAEDFERLRPTLEALSAPSGFAHVGGIGAGHLVKAVHNGVQYGLMQAYAEGYALLTAHQDVDVVSSLRVWQNGCSIRSFLLDQMLTALRDTPALDEVPPQVPDSGMGRWTVEEATRLGIPTPVLRIALQARFASRDDGAAARLLSASRTQVGGQAS
jgi:6-phosphogluconate dehydrogenase